MTEKDSPEERLLRLIRGQQSPRKKRSPVPDAPAQREIAARDTTPADMQPAVKHQKSPKKRPEKTKPVLPRGIIHAVHRIRQLPWKSIRPRREDIRSTHVLIFACGLVLCIFILANWAWFWISPQQLPPVALPGQRQPQLRAIERDFSYYGNILSQRELFKLYTPPSSRQGSGGPAKATLEQMARQINLLGIILGDTPQAIVEDKTSRQTHYLSEGEYIGDIEILRIEKGNVTIGNAEETLDLNL